MINGAALEEAPHSVNQLYSQCPGLREAARTMVEKRREIVGAARSLYLTIREFAITHNQDSKVDIIGTDNLVNNVVLIIKNTGTTNDTAQYTGLGYSPHWEVRVYCNIECC